MKIGPGDQKVTMQIVGEDLDQLKRFTIDMGEAFELDKKIEKYAGKKPMNFYQWDMDCLLAVINLALKDHQEYPDKASSAYIALERLRNRMLDEYCRAYGQSESGK